ncbi:hypothetical protein E2C01_028069 [Portunus trituberculatus]|uniref:MADF domain-containing protein n=1 Tax=Portunus trituberculatus TaxID=210409 RepID=A0A5B7EJQ3_PORTR|nr:hypothetical protein [Portunus trituberculatus]
MKALYPEIQDITPDNVQTKYTNLRTSFKRELKKIQTLKSGSAGKIELADSQWPLFDSMLFLSDVDPGPSCTTATFDSHVPMCSLEENDDLFPSTGNSTLDMGSSSENVICIKAGTGTSNCEDTPS